MIYYSPSPGGFYNTESHGELHILVVDPNWSRPIKGGVSDESAVPPLVEIDNPACLIPEGAVQISDELYQALLAAPTRGKIVVPGPDGYPVEADLPPMSSEETEAVERVWRDSQLALTDPLVSRHRDEIEEGGATTLASRQYAELQAYRRQLRDWPQGEQFPLAEHRPITPAWLIEQIQ